MKNSRSIALTLTLSVFVASCRAQHQRLLLDVHHLEPGKGTLADVAEAHGKDLAVQDEHDVRYLRYWRDESSATVFCLVEAPSSEAAAAVHRAAHGLVADELHEVVPGILPATASAGGKLFMDTHRMGSAMRAEEVADAHRKDLAVQAAHGVRCLNYWVDEQKGYVFCLAEAPNADALVDTHREAHGLIPATVQPVVEGR